LRIQVDDPFGPRHSLWPGAGPAGQLQPWQHVQVMAPASPGGENLARQQGDQVSAGDVLLELSDEGRSKAVLAQARGKLRYARRKLEARAN